MIRKEIWLNVGKRFPQVPPDKIKYPVFFVYNYMDPSQAFAEMVGCRVNEEPIFDLQEAIALANEQEIGVRKSGKWVDVEDIKIA